MTLITPKFLSHLELIIELRWVSLFRNTSSSSKSVYTNPVLTFPHVCDTGKERNGPLGRVACAADVAFDHVAQTINKANTKVVD